jgi:hypothetical protein
MPGGVKRMKFLFRFESTSYNPQLSLIYSPERRYFIPNSKTTINVKGDHMYPGSHIERNIDWCY